MNWKRLYLATAALFLAITFAAGILLLNLGTLLDRSEPPRQADAIVILGGEGGGFYRTRKALQLYEQGYAPVVVFSGGTMLSSGLECSSAALSLEAAAELGFPSGAAIIADGSQSTYDEAVRIGALAQEAGWQSLLLVTDLPHTRRSQRTFASQLPDVDIAVVASDNPYYFTSRWWRTEFGLLGGINEALKLGFYWVQHGIRPF